MPGPYRAAMGKRDLAVSFGGVRAPRPTHGFSSEVVGRPALWPPWPFAAAGSCGPGMPGPYRAAMGKRDMAVSFGGVRAPRPTHGFSSGVVGRPVLWPPWPFALAAMSVGGVPYSGKTKKRDGHCPVSFFLKEGEKQNVSPAPEYERNHPSTSDTLPTDSAGRSGILPLHFCLKAFRFRCTYITSFLSNLQDVCLYNVL